MKEGLIYISDRLGQLRYSDGNANNRWLQPLSSYKALKTIKRGQAVSVATEAEIKSVLTEEQYATYESDPSPYIVPTNTKIHNRCIGLALEYAELDGEVHILSSGQFEYNGNKEKEYDPGFTTDEISKKVYVSNEEGKLTTSSEVAYENYNNIIQIGHIIDAPNSTKNDQNKTILEVQIQGDDRGILESTQFEAVLGEDVYIKADEPLTVFAFGQEDASKFKIKLCTRNMVGNDDTIDLDASFIVIKKLSGEYCLIKFSENEISSEDDTDKNTLQLLENRYEWKKTSTIGNINFTDSKDSIEKIIEALNEVIKGMGDNLTFTGEPSTSEDGNYSSATLELSENGGYYDIYISNSLRDFLRDTVTLQNGSLSNKNTAVLADIRVEARRNVFGVLVNDYEEDITLTKGSRILLMRQGELVVNTKKTLAAVGKKFVLGESGSVICVDDALRTADSSNTIGYLKKVHGEGDTIHYHFVIDIGENIPKVEYSTYPVGYLKPYYGNIEGETTPDFGYLVTGKTYPIEEYKELYERLLGWYPASAINASINEEFTIPLIKDKDGTPMQIKYVTDGIFERLPKVPYLRDFGNIFETDGACSINDLDITALLSINTTFSEVDTLPLENLDIHLYIDPDYTEGAHNWREVRPGFFKYNNVDTYGFEWELKKDTADAENTYGKYTLSANIGDSRGIYYVSSDNVAPISCKNVPYKLYVAVKQTNIEHFDLRNLMSNYISNTIYNGNNEVDDIYAVTGEAVVNAIRENKWFKTLENFDESSEINFGGGEKKLNTIVNVQTNKAIKLNCTIDSNDDNTVLIGETDKEIDGQKTKYTTLEIKDGKAFLNKINTYLFKNEGGNFVNDDNEVATVNDVLDHALMSIDDNGETVKNAIIHNEGSKNGRIHGMKFGKDGNVDASTLCNFKVGIAHGQEIDNIGDAKIPIIYKSGNDVHTPLQGNLDYYTNLDSDSKTTKLFTLYPSYDPELDKLDLAFKKDNDNIINKISFGGAKIVAETELPSLSKYKKIFSENKIEREGQFTTELADNSTSDDVSFDFAYILQAAYELPMAYWKYRDSNEYNIGPIIERLQDTINYFENTENIEYKVDGDEKAYTYTPEQRAGITKSLKDIISESGKSVRVDDMVGFLLAAAGETQKRLAKLERSTYGRDVMESEKETIEFTNMPDVNSKHTHYGLNRLVRAICLELFGKANPDVLEADEATLTSLSRMDDIERQIRGSRKTPDPVNGSIANNNINDFGNINNENYSISSSYPYKENVTDNKEIINNEDTFAINEQPSIIDTKETIFGTGPAADKDSFNGVVDAIYRITQKVDVLTEAINGTNDILQPHTTLNKIKRNIETLIKEVYFDGAKEGEPAYKDELGKDELFDENGTKPSRVDEITDVLYNNVLEYKNWTTDKNGTLTETRDGTEGPTLAGYEGADYNNGELTITSPSNIEEYKNINIIDIILKAIGNQIILKHYDDQLGSAQEKRFNKDISERLYKIEQCLDKVVLRLKDSSNFEDFTKLNFTDENTTKNIDAFSEALSGLLGYTYSRKDSTEKDIFVSSKGVVPEGVTPLNEADSGNNQKYSAEHAIKTKSNIIAGLENLLYRVQNEEKDNFRIKKILGEELWAGVEITATQANGDIGDIQKVEQATDVDDKQFTLSEDIKDLLATIYGEDQNDSNKAPQTLAGDNTYFRHRTKARVTTDGGSFLNGDNIIENIVNELYYIPKPLNNKFKATDTKGDAVYYTTDSEDSVSKKFFDNKSLIAGDMRADNFKPFLQDGKLTGGRKSRLDILESDVRALRKFIGLSDILSLGNDNIDTADKIEVAINGEFTFSQANGKYFVNDGDYAIGEEDALTSSFIESFFNLMKRVDGLSAAIGESDTGNSTSLNGRINTVTSSVSALEDTIRDLQPTVKTLKDTVTGDNGLAKTVSGLVNTVTNEETGLQKTVKDLNEDVGKLKAAKPLIVSTIVEKGAREALENNFTVSGNTHIYITPNTGKTYYCNVSFILDPDCEFIGYNNQNDRKKNINSAIKQIMPCYFNNYKEMPTWSEATDKDKYTDAKNDTNAYVVYNRNFSNIVIGSSLSMGVDTSSSDDTNSICCGISESGSGMIGCKGNITKVGCIMSNLVISEGGTGKQYSPFYFELVYNTTGGTWEFNWKPEPETPSET